MILEMAGDALARLVLRGDNGRAGWLYAGAGEGLSNAERMGSKFCPLVR